MITHLQSGIERHSAVEYLWEELRQGKTLASLVLRSVNFSKGTIESLVPDSYNPLEISQFDRGHIIGRGERQTFKLGTISGVATRKIGVPEGLAGLICTLLDSESLCLVENHLARVGDSWLNHAKSRLATHGAEVYHFLTAADCDAAKVRDAILESSHPPLSWGALGRIPADHLTSGPKQIALTTDELKSFANTVRRVFVSAYDGEGYLVWAGEPSSELQSP